jgi:molybdopterin molybdotransferase
MALLPVDQALKRLLDDVEPLPSESVALADAYDRVLAGPVVALRTQPPFAASAMDGYAVRGADAEKALARLKVVGEVAAGHNLAGSVGSGEAARIFTGAPLPDGADTVVIQENVAVLGGDMIELAEPTRAGANVRRAGLDFEAGDTLLDQGHLLGASALSLAASANRSHLDVVRQPLVAIIATGDELRVPGSEPGPGQIISSNAYGVMGSARAVGARALDLGIAADRKEAIASLVRQAVAANADVIVTMGGASVGDHDLVHGVLTGEGMKLDFWKIAMRPGKPFMFGRLGNIRCIGLPGNPVASLVCSQLFLKPLLARLGGRPFRQNMGDALLGAPMAANDLRQDYVRATLSTQGSALVATPFNVQDSSMLRTMTRAGCLIERLPFAPAAEAGAPCRILTLA